MNTAPYDFYYRVTNRATGKKNVHHARLHGDSETFLESRRPQYEKEGFDVAPATEKEYRETNWRKAA